MRTKILNEQILWGRLRRLRECVHVCAYVCVCLCVCVCVCVHLCVVCVHMYNVLMFVCVSPHLGVLCFCTESMPLTVEAKVKHECNLYYICGEIVTT